MKRSHAHPSFTNGNVPTGYQRMDAGRYLEAIHYSNALWHGAQYRRYAIRTLLERYAREGNTDATLALLDAIDYYTPRVARCSECEHTQSTHDWIACLHDGCDCTLRYGRGSYSLEIMIQEQGYMI